MRMWEAVSVLAMIGTSLGGACELTTGATNTFPAELRSQALPLFATGPGAIADQANWSGAHYDTRSATLWLARGGSTISAYRELDGGGFAHQLSVTFVGDAEAISQGAGPVDEVYLLLEKQERIVQLRVNASAAVELGSWSVKNLAASAAGMEGMAFVPDAVLAHGDLTDTAGNPYTASQYGTGGIFLLANQHGGDVHAIDLAPNGSLHAIGVYATPLRSTRALEFHVSSELLYLLDGDGAARLRLTSTPGVGGKRVLTAVDVYAGPGPKGAEGMALRHDASKSWLIVTDDDDAAGNAAVLMYQAFSP